MDFYLPGYKAGGPIKTLATMVEHLKEIEFQIITRDRDLNDKAAYAGVPVNQWSLYRGVRIFYASPKTISFFGLRHLIKNTPHDAIYLNSFFSPAMTFLPIAILLLSGIKTPKIVLAPRGEFSCGALSIKPFKKKIYIILYKFFKRFIPITFQASSEIESADISTALGDSHIIIAPDLLPKISESNIPHINRGLNDVSKILKIIYLSRVTPIKKLDFVLKILSKVTFDVQFNIYGPIEDLNYWKVCQKRIDNMSSNVKVSYQGGVNQEDVAAIFSKHDIFILPTLGENFGHVIFESLSSGTCVLLSPNTPWLPDENQEAIKILSLKSIDDWVDIVNKWAKFDDKTKLKHRQAALAYAQNYYLKENRKAYQDNYNLWLGTKQSS